MSRPYSAPRPALHAGAMTRAGTTTRVMRCLGAVAMVALLAAGSASAQEKAGKIERTGGANGVGFVLGNINGFSFKTWLADQDAIHIRLGADGSRFNSLVLSNTYVHHFRPVEIPDGSYSLPFYVGGGLRGKVASELGSTYLDGGLVGVVGMSVLVPTLPVELFVEVRPQALFYNYDVGGFGSKTLFGFTVEGGMGVNYYF